MNESQNTNSTAPTANSTGQKKKRSPAKILFKIAILVLVTAVVVVPLVAWLLLGGTIRGAEFCPADFSKRQFSYRVSPLTGKQTKGISYTNSFSQISDYLVTENYLPAATKPKTWHLLWDNQLHEITAETEAQILDTYLNQTNNGWELSWVVWSDEHPEHAKLFWPLISQMAQDELYVDVPTVMESVRHPDEVDVFETRLTDLVASIYVERAADAKQRDDETLSETLLARAAELTSSKMRAGVRTDKSAAENTEDIDSKKAVSLDAFGKQAEADDQPSE